MAEENLHRERITTPASGAGGGDVGNGGGRIGGGEVMALVMSGVMTISHSVIPDSLLFAEAVKDKDGETTTTTMEKRRRRRWRIDDDDDGADDGEKDDEETRFSFDRTLEPILDDGRSKRRGTTTTMMTTMKRLDNGWNRRNDEARYR